VYNKNKVSNIVVVVCSACQ